jgi:Cu(I)/Ag(I) efflux system membrane protein CusA/SilA
MNTGSLTRTGIVLLAVPFSAIGAVVLLWALDYNMSVAAWVGLIALAGLDAETGIFMLLYLELAEAEAKAKGRFKTLKHLKEAVVHGAVKRVRPKVMTVACAFTGLLPIMFSTGAGADVMKRIAAPMLGGLFSSFALELIVYPAVFLLWKWNTELRPRTDKTLGGSLWRLVHRIG